MTMYEIYNNGNLSIRSYRACINNGIDNLSDLQEYLRINKNFLRFKNCGRKSNEELINICYKYNENKDFEILNESNIKITIFELTRVQREVINNFILVNTNHLSVRSKNAVRLILEGNFKIKNFAQKILFSETFNVKNIKNIGAKCIPELEIYISNIKDFLNEVSKSENENFLISLKNNFLIQHTFSISNIPSKILESESIFLLTEFLLNNYALFDETKTIIIKKAFKIYQNHEDLTLDQIAEKVNLTRERVRQIRAACLEDLFNKLLFTQNFTDDLYQKYNIDINSNQLEIDNEIVDTINNTNNTNLSREFITYILYAYLWDKFSLIGEIEDVLQQRSFNTRNRYNWNSFYLIKKEIVIEIDFNALANDINNRISDRIVESYSFNFKSYLSKFLTKNNIEFLYTAFPIAEKIINDEFELYLDLDENITFKRNTVKQGYEYSYDALEQLGRPSKVTEIFEKVLELYPNYITTEAKIRVSMKRKNGFVPIGRKSIFGLKKWEKELDNFKGGTIKNIITELLENSNEPLHIVEILYEIHKFREKTNERNVITNLKLDPNKSFIIFNQKFIGLSSKKNDYDLNKYENLPIQLGKIIQLKIKKESNINFNQMMIFLKDNYNLTQKDTKNILTVLNIKL